MWYQIAVPLGTFLVSVTTLSIRLLLFLWAMFEPTAPSRTVNPNRTRSRKPLSFPRYRW